MGKKITDNTLVMFRRHLKNRKADFDKIKNTWKILEETEKTHYGLGKLMLMDYLADISDKALLVIGSAGVGKSVSMSTLYKNISRNKVYLDTLTVGGLRHISKKTSFDNISLLVDDLSKSMTEYSQLHTAIILTELAYTGFFKRYTAQGEIDIVKYKGSAIVNLQPLLFAKLIRNPEYETDIRDKALRYYHIRYPIKPTTLPPKLEIKTKYGINKVKIDEKLMDLPSYYNALENFAIAYSKSRAIIHLNDLLKANALLNDRLKVEREDVYVIELLSRNFKYEQYIFYKEDLEGARILDPNLLPLLGLFITYGKFTVKDIMRTYQIRKSQAYEILIRLEDYCDLIRNTTTIIPKPETVRLLIDVGELYEYS